MKKPHSSLISGYALYISVASAWKVGQEVITTSGPVSGHAATLFNDVSEYLAIPFAAPPVNDLRFMPPKDFPRNSKTIVAAKFGPDCPSQGAATKKTNTTATGTSVVASTLGAIFGHSDHSYRYLKD
jgi:hypothetical protein